MKTNRGIAHLFLLIVVIFVAIGAIGYLAYQNAQLKKQTEETTITPEDAEQQVVEPTESPETANWKTYKNDRLGFELKLPEKYLVILETNNAVEIGTKYTPDADALTTFLTLSTNPADFENNENYENCSQVSANLKVDEYPAPCLIDENQYDQEESIKDASLDGVKALSFYLDLGVDNQYHFIQTVNSPRIQLKMYISGGGLDRLFNQILSTFKFTKIQNFSTWNEYKSPVVDGLGYELKYPDTWEIIPWGGGHANPEPIELAQGFYGKQCRTATRGDISILHFLYSDPETQINSNTNTLKRDGFKGSTLTTGDGEIVEKLTGNLTGKTDFYVYMVSPKGFFQIFSRDDCSEGLSEIFDKVISSFKLK